MQGKFFSTFLIATFFLTFSAVAQNNHFEKICDSPQIFVCEHFLSDEECDHLIEMGRPDLLRSTVADPSRTTSTVHAARTSLGMFLPYGCMDPLVNSLHQRIADITKIPKENGENMQILYYGVGAQYLPHYDTFDPNAPGGLIHYNRGGQRVATFMIYLNTPEKGGETIFPKARLKVAPVKGKAVLFYNVKESGEVDPMSYHGGAPVLNGEKWIITRWLREKEFH